MKQFLDLDLWIYCPGAKAYMNGRKRQNTSNIHVILGCEKYFCNIKSKAVDSHQVAGRVYGYRYENALEEAVNLRDNPDRFLDAVIGTHDRRTKEYKKFIVKVDEYKAWLMKKILKEEK